ncbi:MAG: hypothetical protein K8R90_06120 [Candidatus Cloacimonetes bacterium]|nr:hypothetical protein [Candidatus Cloacimonadota bacterium]
MEQEIIIQATFVDKNTGKPLVGPTFWVEVFHKTGFQSSLINTEELGEEGQVAIVSNLETLQRLRPNIYFVLHRNDQVIFKSKLFKKADFLQGKRVSIYPFTRDFGPFEV